MDTVSVFMLIAGVVMTLRGVWCVWHGRRSRKWPTTSGVVTGSGTAAVGVAEWLQQRKTKRSDIRYKYSVRGQTHFGSRVFFGEFANDFTGKAGEDTARYYHEGRKIEVYFDPKRPQRAVLEPGVHWHATFTLLSGMALCVGILLHTNVIGF